MKAIQFQFAFASKRLRNMVGDSLISSYPEYFTCHQLSYSELCFTLDMPKSLLGYDTDKPFILEINCSTNNQINAVLETFYPTDDYPVVQVKNMPAKVLLEIV